MPAPRILILTAAFGEGHNSAARNIALALQAQGAETVVCDPCMQASPWITRHLCRAYRLVTTYAPRCWHRIYRSTDEIDFTKQRFRIMRKPERFLEKQMSDFSPDVVVCTYPLYPYFLQRIQANATQPVPVVTVITDSIAINGSWTKAQVQRWLVTDEITRQSLIKQGLPSDAIKTTGFPVHPTFATMAKLHASTSTVPFRILYFPTAKRGLVPEIATAMLEGFEHTHITIVLGKNVRRLYRQAKAIQQRFPGRVRLLGWTRRVPQLLCSHHLVIGKAGGATVHEAIAAQCPMLVHHLVPGQEEGNLQLLMMLGGGMLTETARDVQLAMQRLLQQSAKHWREMKHHLDAHHSDRGGENAAQVILECLGNHAEMIEGDAADFLPN